MTRFFDKKVETKAHAQTETFIIKIQKKCVVKKPSKKALSLKKWLVSVWRRGGRGSKIVRALSLSVRSIYTQFAKKDRGLSAFAFPVFTGSLFWSVHSRPFANSEYIVPTFHRVL